MRAALAVLVAIFILSHAGYASATTNTLTCTTLGNTMTCNTIASPAYPACAKHNNSGILTLEQFRILAPCNPNGVEVEIDPLLSFGITLGDAINGNASPNDWTNVTDRLLCMGAIQDQVNDWIIYAAEKVFLAADMFCNGTSYSSGGGAYSSGVGAPPGSGSGSGSMHGGRRLLRHKVL